MGIIYFLFLVAAVIVFLAVLGFISRAKKKKVQKMEELTSMYHELHKQYGVILQRHFDLGQNSDWSRENKDHIENLSVVFNEILVNMSQNKIETMKKNLDLIEKFLDQISDGVKRTGIDGSVKKTKTKKLNEHGKNYSIFDSDTYSLLGGLLSEEMFYKISP